MYLFLLVVCLPLALLYALSIIGQRNPHSRPMPRVKDWITAGGVLGLAILAARVTRVPLATLLTAMPFLVEYLRRAEQEGQQERVETGANDGGMTREEAALILGVKAYASDTEIRDAHRRLIQQNHPDRGGSDYLAAKINQARDVLMRR